MTPEERAAEIIGGCLYEARQDIADAIRTATEEEREACAAAAFQLITDTTGYGDTDYWIGYRTAALHAAAFIRARGVGAEGGA